MHKNQMFKGEKKLCHQTSEDLDIYNQNLLKIRARGKRKRGGGEQETIPNIRMKQIERHK